MGGLVDALGVIGSFIGSLTHERPMLVSLSGVVPRTLVSRCAGHATANMGSFRVLIPYERTPSMHR